MDASEAVFGFLRSAAGRAMVSRALRRRGLPAGLADDLEGEILRRTVAAAARGPIDNPAGFATHAAEYAAGDLLRGELRRPLPLSPTAAEEDDAGSAVDVSSGVDVTADTVARTSLRDIRRALADEVRTQPSGVATALAYLAATVDEAPPGPGCPAPVGGAGPVEAAEWTGLWYGGRLDCFPEPGAADLPAVRKRRSRAAATMRATLTAAALIAGLCGGDDG